MALGLVRAAAVESCSPGALVRFLRSDLAQRQAQLRELVFRHDELRRLVNGRNDPDIRCFTDESKGDLGNNSESGSSNGASTSPPPCWPWKTEEEMLALHSHGQDTHATADVAQERAYLDHISLSSSAIAALGVACPPESTCERILKLAHQSADKVALRTELNWCQQVIKALEELLESPESSLSDDGFIRTPCSEGTCGECDALKLQISRAGTEIDEALQTVLSSKITEARTTARETTLEQQQAYKQLRALAREVSAGILESAKRKTRNTLNLGGDNLAVKLSTARDDLQRALLHRAAREREVMQLKLMVGQIHGQADQLEAMMRAEANAAADEYRAAVNYATSILASQRSADRSLAQTDALKQETSEDLRQDATHLSHTCFVSSEERIWHMRNQTESLSRIAEEERRALQQKIASAQQLQQARAAEVEQLEKEHLAKRDAVVKGLRANHDECQNLTTSKTFVPRSECEAETELLTLECARLKPHVEARQRAEEAHVAQIQRRQEHERQHTSILQASLRSAMAKAQNLREVVTAEEKELERQQRALKELQCQPTQHDLHNELQSETRSRNRALALAEELGAELLNADEEAAAAGSLRCSVTSSLSDSASLDASCGDGDAITAQRILRRHARRLEERHAPELLELKTEGRRLEEFAESLRESRDHEKDSSTALRGRIAGGAAMRSSRLRLGGAEEVCHGNMLPLGRASNADTSVPPDIQNLESANIHDAGDLTSPDVAPSPPRLPHDIISMPVTPATTVLSFSVSSDGEGARPSPSRDPQWMPPPLLPGSARLRGDANSDGDEPWHRPNIKEMLKRQARATAEAVRRGEVRAAYRAMEASAARRQ